MKSGIHKWKMGINYSSSDKSGIIWGVIESRNKEQFRNPTLAKLNEFAIGSGGTQLIYPKFGTIYLDKVKSYSLGYEKKTIICVLDLNIGTFKVYEESESQNNLIVETRSN